MFVNPLDNPILRQCLVVIVANFSYLGFGLETGWTSPVIAQLKDANQTVLPAPISDHDAAWVVSIGILVGAFGMLISGFLMDRLGRKLFLVLACLPRIAHCFLLIFASEVWMLLLARALNGFTDIAVICVVFTYSSEIASKEIRGALGSISQMSYALGTMIMLTIGPFQTYQNLNIMNTVIVCMLYVPMLFLPETPYFLFSRGRKKESIKVLTFLRGSKEAANEELKEYSTYSNVSINKMKLLKDMTVLKSLGKALILTIGSQFTGYNSLSYYLQTVFTSTHTNVKPEVSSVVIGCIELLACFCTILMTDRFGRKPILTSTLVLIGVGMVGMGTFFYYKDQNTEIVGFLNYLPLLSVMIIIFFFNAGIGSIMMMYVAELFNGSSRATCVSIVVFFSSLATFLVIRHFAAITSSIGPMSTYYGFSVGSIILCVFVIFCMPETNKKTFGEIQHDMKKEKKRDDQVNEIYQEMKT